MIAIFHIIYWTVNELFNCLQTRLRPPVEKQTESLFDVDKVIYCQANVDAETGLKFDPPLYLQRYTAVQQVLLNKNWRGKIAKVVDFGCAECSFFKYLKGLVGVQEVLLVDIDRDLLEYNVNRVYPFNVDYLCRRKEPLRVEILQGSIASPDPRLISVDAVICIEIVEHLYPDTLDALPHNIFGYIQPKIVVFTTPNADFNVLFTNFSGIRHYDHKFEWTREQFNDWAHNLTVRYPKYSVHLDGIGLGPKGTEHLGCCSQMAVFVKQETDEDCCDDLRQLLMHAFNKPKNLFNEEDSEERITLEDCKYCAINCSDITDILSNGVCTYETYNLVKGDNSCEHSVFRYNLIREVDYPYEIDNRTQDEIILHETEYRIHRTATFNSTYYNNDKERHEIPLYSLTSNKDGPFISCSDLRSILEKAGWPIEECDIHNSPTLCVIYADYSSTSECSRQSQSPDLNFSTDVSCDSEVQWDATKDSTKVWADLEADMDSTKAKSESTTEMWDEASSNDPSANNATATTETLFESCVENGSSPVSDPCFSGEQICSNDERVELLFDSGYQVSTSSIDLSPELSKDWLRDENKQVDETVKSKSDLESIRISKSEKYNKSDLVNFPIAMKSDGNIIKLRKRNKCKVEEPRVVNLVVPAVAAPPAAEPEIPVVENGDLANNNRDREGNNYQAAENVEQIDDNALPRPENLDEHNENHIVLENNDLENIPDFPEDEDAPESLEDASREVLYDPNSEVSLTDEFLVVGEAVPYDDFNLPLVQRLPRVLHPSEESFQSTIGFPNWLLLMLNMTRDEDLDADQENAHFYSQGDGLGIHPSLSEVPDEDTSSSSSESSQVTESTAQGNAEDATTVTTAETSVAESSFQDALDFFVAEIAHDSGPSSSRTQPGQSNPDTGQSSSDDSGQKK